MSVDPETRAFYDRAATDYADKFHESGKADADLRAFMAAVAPGGRVLDLGCGPGRSAKLLTKAGFDVDATDASEGMISVARDRYGVAARLATFDDLDTVGEYDGIWANFSLLHAPRTDVPGLLHRIHRALKTGGVLHLGLKVGTGEDRDHLGRRYTYFEEAELRGLLSDAGLTVAALRHGHGKGMAGTDDPFMIVLANA